VISLERMRRLDAWIGWPLATLLGFLPRKARLLPASPQRIVIVKLSGIGSLLVCAGVLRALRRSQPQARIMVVALEGPAAAARLLSEVDEVMVISTASPWTLVRDGFRALRKLRQQRADVIADIEYFSRLSTLFCALSGARFRLGFGLPAWWRRRLIDGGTAFCEESHFCACVARLLQPLGVDEQQLPAVTLALPVPAEAAAEALLAAESGGTTGTTWMAVNPHAAELCVQRRWPLERFAEVSDALLRRHPELRIAIPGTAGERERTEQLRNLIPAERRGRVSNLAGRTDLATLAAVLRRCRLVLTNDTGVMHLAAAMGSPLVALFGPESPVRYGPVGTGRVHVFCGAAPCGPCLNYSNRKRAPCGEEPAACLLAIPVTEVRSCCEAELENR